MTTVSNGTVMSVVASALSQDLSFKDVQDAAAVECSTLLTPDARPPEHVMPKIVALLMARDTPTISAQRSISLSKTAR